MRVISLFVFIAVTAWAQSASSGIAKGIEDFQHGRYAEARDALAKYPADPGAQTFLALSRAALGSCKQADPVLDRRFGVTF